MHELNQEIFKAAGFEDRLGDPLLPGWDGMLELMSNQTFKEGAGWTAHP